MNLPNHQPEKKIIQRPPAVYQNIPTYFGIGDDLHGKKLEPQKPGRSINSPTKFR